MPVDRNDVADAAAWAGPGGPLAVHVNVSAVQLTDPGFLDTVRDCLAEHAMAPETLVLEITEGMVLDSAPVRYALDRLAALGVSIAVDDFGTGYSALSIIRTLPLDIVKLDKSFLSNGPSHAADEAVVAAIVQMAGSLGAVRDRRGRGASRPAAVPAVRRGRRGTGLPVPAPDAGRPVRAVAAEPVGRRRGGREPDGRHRHPDRAPDRLTAVRAPATGPGPAAPRRRAGPRSA